MSYCNIIDCEYCYAMFDGKLCLEKHQKVCPKNNEKSAKELKFIIASEKGLIDELEKYLNEGVDINCSDGQGITPLIGACSKGKMESVKFLLQHGADINACGEACFSENIELVKYLLDRGCDKEKAYNTTENKEIRELIMNHKD